MISTLTNTTLWENSADDKLMIIYLFFPDDIFCHVSCVIGASNWYWLTVGQGLLSMWQVRVEGEFFYFFCFFTFIPVPLSSLSLSFISSALFSISFLPFSGRWHKMTHKGWHVVKPQHNKIFFIFILIFPEDNQHEMSKAFFLGKIRNIHLYFKMSSAKIFRG